MVIPDTRPLILVVEDTHINMQILERILTRSGYDTDSATNGIDALKRVAERRPDIILLDIVMPEMDGFEVCEELKAREETADIPIIFLTAKTASEDIVRGFEIGAVDYVTKPFNRAELLARVRTHLELKQTKDRQQALIQSLQKQVLRADRLATLGQLIAGVTHEINNPNNAIYFNLPVLTDYLNAMKARIMAQTPEGTPCRILDMPCADFFRDVFQLIADMTAGSSRISRIVSEFRDFVRGRATDVKQLESVAAVLRSTENLMGKQIRKMVSRFDIEIPENLPPVIMNAGKIEQVLVNLVLNAAQAAAETDRRDVFITVSARNEPADPDHVHIQVADNGPGIAADIAPRIFDPFFTTKERKDGTGLGLSIARQIVEEHGGTLTLDTSPGRGTRFHIRLPKDGIEQD